MLLNIIAMQEKKPSYLSFLKFVFFFIDDMAEFVGFNSNLSSYIPFLNIKTAYASKDVTHATLLELVWTLTPSFILFLIAIPSFILLYSFDEILSPALSNKITGFQWFWGYEYPPAKIIISPHHIIYKKTTILSYMSNFPEIIPNNQYRLLETDTSFILPIHITVRLLITAADVLHSWAVPSLGIKLDAVPGRLNSINITPLHEGVLYGQCSELCGVQHSQMPIRVLVVSLLEYSKYIITIYKK